MARFKLGIETDGDRRHGAGKRLAGDAQKAGLAEAKPALRVKYVGQFGAHAAAKRAGFLTGDLIVAFDGQTGFARETELLAYAAMHRKPGDQVAVTIRRDGQTLELSLPMQP